MDRFDYNIDPPFTVAMTSFETLRFALAGTGIPQHRKTKKADVAETRRYSTTSAYSLTSPPVGRVALYLVIRRH